MPEKSTDPYLFGDLLALARQSWVRQMASRLERAGYSDYRRSDAAALRILSDRAVPVGRLGEVLGVSRQAARKLAEALVDRGFARLARDADDARKLNVTLTDAGAAYAAAIRETIRELNRELAERVAAADLEAADRVLRAALTGPGERRRAEALVKPPRRRGG
ncbi:MAG TPA: MarR family transcriptional regulator [Solirubrobacteraceae bacterium]|nr:MarR family transcriptional regulator [Solirubrobacteraceae bacterium]